MWLTANKLNIMRLKTKYDSEKSLMDQVYSHDREFKWVIIIINNGLLVKINNLLIF